MKIIGVDLHTRQQSIAMLDDETGEFMRRCSMKAEQVRSYSALPKPVLVGLEATGSMPWFLRLLEELNIEYRVGHPRRSGRRSRASEKNDRRDARSVTLLAENRFPAIWMPSREQHDLQILLRHRDQVCADPARVQLSLQAVALSHGLRRYGPTWLLRPPRGAGPAPQPTAATERRRNGWRCRRGTIAGVRRPGVTTWLVPSRKTISPPFAGPPTPADHSAPPTSRAPLSRPHGAH